MSEIDTSPVPNDEVNVRTERPGFLEELQGVATMCERSLSPGDGPMLAAKFREAASLISIAARQCAEDRTTLRTVRASLAAAEEARDQAAAVAEADKVEIVAWRTRALRAEAALAARKPCEPAAWWAETGTAGASDGCNRPFWLEHEAVAYVRQHGGHVAPLFRSWSCDPADPCAFAQDLASESRTLDVLLAEAKERAKDAEARAERIRAALMKILKTASNGMRWEDKIFAIEEIASDALSEQEAPDA